mmetsp:Transcript_67743/g.161702  ORF Transcript_67743/g.161702 Transcript_67743/m.161702 type:complete len:517 (+) Transcript_67743:2061-3611(+)
MVVVDHARLPCARARLDREVQPVVRVVVGARRPVRPALHRHLVRALALVEASRARDDGADGVVRRMGAQLRARDGEHEVVDGRDQHDLLVRVREHAVRDVEVHPDDDARGVEHRHGGVGRAPRQQDTQRAPRERARLRRGVDARVVPVARQLHHPRLHHLRVGVASDEAPGGGVPRRVDGVEQARVVGDRLGVAERVGHLDGRVLQALLPQVLDDLVLGHDLDLGARGVGARGRAVELREACGVDGDDLVLVRRAGLRHLHREPRVVVDGGVTAGDGVEVEGDGARGGSVPERHGGQQQRGRREPGHRGHRRNRRGAVVDEVRGRDLARHGDAGHERERRVERGGRPAGPRRDHAPLHVVARRRVAVDVDVHVQPHHDIGRGDGGRVDGRVEGHRRQIGDHRELAAEHARVVGDEVRVPDRRVGRRGAVGLVHLDGEAVVGVHGERRGGVKADQGGGEAHGGRARLERARLAREPARELHGHGARRGAAVLGVAHVEVGHAVGRDAVVGVGRDHRG